jgi:tripartite ATP-independent transporter DctP family solute receptor
MAGLTRRQFLGAGAAAVLAAACGPTGAPAPASQPEQRPTQPITIKWGHVLAPTEPTHIVALRVAERVKNRTSGLVTIEVFPSSQLGSNRDTYEQARLGSPVMGHIDPGYASEYGVKELGILGGPFLYENLDEIKKVVNSQLVQEWNDQLREKGGLRVLAWNWYFGERHIISGRGYPSPENLRGVKIRTPPNPIWVETFKTLGATPVTLEWAEVYTALAQGVVDAAEAPLSTLFGSKLYEVKKVITLTGHFKAITGHVIGEKFFQSLPKDVQQVLMEEVQKGGEEMSQLTVQQQEDFKKKLAEQGVSFVQPDIEAYKRASRPFYSLGWPPDLYERIQKIIRG